MSRLDQNPFPYFNGEELDLNKHRADDPFFEEAFATHPQSALEPNRSFVGSVIKRQRFTFIFSIAISILSILFLKAGFLQIVHGTEYRTQAEENRIFHKILPAERGIVYDRNGIVLAENIPTFQIVTSKNQLPADSKELALTILNLAKSINRDPFDLFTAIEQAKTRDEQILLATNLDYETAMYLAANEKQYSFIELEIGARRSYITDGVPSLSHILGYTGIINAEEYDEVKDTGYRRFDYLGKQGLESEYETKLRGTYGEESIEVDAFGNVERIISKHDPVDGEDLNLTIDAPLQAYIESVLQTRLDGTMASKASVIALDPNNGDVLALVSWPAYDSNDFTNGIDSKTYSALLADKDQPLYPRAVAGEFPSGSTIKPLYAAAALIEGIITPTTSFLSTGGIRVSLWFFPDWRAGGHGTTNVYWAIADSVNTFFYIIGGGYQDFDGLGIEKMMEWAAKFGFGDQTGLDIPGEADGFLPSPEWKWETKGEQWYIGDTYHVAIGQGDLLATPLQIARLTAVFANKGYLVEPRLNSEKEIKIQQLIDENTATVVRDAMRYTVTGGSAQSMLTVPVEVAGKTGTAQWSTVGIPHSWFTGFAPFEDPEIVLTVLIEEGGDDYLAVPVAKDILNWWFSDR
ncbi:penicillin-binding protein 2 [Candidatus Uhrbacteria bacterium CG10_big_fil_rev_8_21_14_0_10_41_26]|nr:MAG: penicillin-binding protein 2 [Candidatus Uhrbacteria bacterium CG10_big_fil_rev_8_21_14_0_10_41_26]